MLCVDTSKHVQLLLSMMNSTGCGIHVNIEGVCYRPPSANTNWLGKAGC